MTEDNHNKFHYFAIWKDGDGFSGGNAHGRIGYSSKPFIIVKGANTKDEAIEAIYAKIKTKIARGYQFVKIPEE